jgi:hypothetical protein
MLLALQTQAWNNLMVGDVRLLNAQSFPYLQIIHRDTDSVRNKDDGFLLLIPANEGVKEFNILAHTPQLPMKLLRRIDNPIISPSLECLAQYAPNINTLLTPFPKNATRAEKLKSELAAKRKKRPTDSPVAVERRMGGERGWSQGAQSRRAEQEGTKKVQMVVSLPTWMYYNFRNCCAIFVVGLNLTNPI